MKGLILKTHHSAIAARTEEADQKGRKLSRADFLHIAGAAGLGVGALVVGRSLTHASAAGKKTKVDAPILSCGQVAQGYVELQVRAPTGPGATGLPAGFSVQRMTRDAFIANGGWYESDDARLCKASFSGEAFASRYDLAPGGCVTVRMGDLLLDSGASTSCVGPLNCGTAYVFRAFGHANSALNRSDFTTDLLCTTAPCGGGVACTSPWCDWGSHYPAPANCANPPAVDTPWPVESLTLGTVSYSICELVSILDPFNDESRASGALVGLARQLIAVKLNIARGSDGTAVSQAAADADAVIGGLVVPPVGSGFLAVTASTTALIKSLNDYNSGLTGPGVCPNSAAQCDLD